MGFVIWDTETCSGTELKEAGAWHYAECPTTYVMRARFRNHLGQKETWRPGMAIPKMWQEAVYRGWLIIAHNVAFEKAILRKILVPDFKWPMPADDQWHDTMAVCAMKALPLSLDDAALVLQLPVQKDMEGSKLVRSLSKPDRKGWLPTITLAVDARVDAYCEQDVDAELALHKRVGVLPAHERRMWLYDQRMNERGIRLDLPYVDACQRIVDRASAPLKAEFLELTELPKFGSPRLREWLAGHGVALPNLQAETVDEWLADTTLEPDHPAHRALTIRRLVGSAAVKKLGAMRACVCSDGRARGLFQWHGAVPGRGTGRLLQPQNFPRGFTYEYNPDDLVAAIMHEDLGFLEMLFGNPIAAVASGLRHAIIPDPGKVFIAGDFRQIQARIVLAIAGQHDKTALMAAGEDIYCDMGGTIHGRSITKKDKAERQDGKNAVLGCGFGIGWAEFQRKFCKDKSDKDVQHIIHTYRKVWAPKVPKFWYAMDDAATNTVWRERPHSHSVFEYRLEDGWMVCRGPSGHDIFYHNPTRDRMPKPWAPDELKATFYFDSQKAGQWRRIYTHGGSLTENVVMRMEVDIKNAAIHNLEQAGYPVILDIHDELVCEVSQADEKRFSDCMLDLPKWVQSCQIPVSIDKPWISDRYRK